MRLPILNGCLSSLYFEIDLGLQLMVFFVPVVDNVVVSESSGCGFLYLLDLSHLVSCLP